jgi:YVTN family beta-propeller protein
MIEARGAPRQKPYARIACVKIRKMITRRTFSMATLGAGLGGAGFLAGCGRREPASGFPGYAFIANEEGGAVAAVDLGVFAVARHIRVDGAPTAVVANPRTTRVYALTPGNGCVHEIRAGTLTFARKLRVASQALEMRLTPAGNALYVLCREPRQLVRVDLSALRVAGIVPLIDEPTGFDISPDGRTAAVSSSSGCSLTLVDLDSSRGFPPVRGTGELGLVRFQPYHGDAARARSDSEQVIAANVSQRMLSVFHVPSRRLIVNLPLAVRPDYLCFNSDGGQLFVTGEGVDAVVVVYPYYTPQIGQTVLAGHSPGAMAASASPGYLFVANPKSADVSILDIETSTVLMVTPVGAEPAFIAITPDDKYALVLNQVSGDMAVIRIPNVTAAAREERRWKKGPLFTLIPVGSKPVSAAVVPI